MPSLTLKEQMIGEFVIFSLTGSLLVSTMQKLKDVFLMKMKEGRYYFGLDMTGLAHIDSSGLGLLSNMRKKIDAANGHLVLFSVPSLIRQGLDQTGMTENFTIVRDESEFQNTFIL